MIVLSEETREQVLVINKLNPELTRARRHTNLISICRFESTDFKKHSCTDLPSEINKHLAAKDHSLYRKVHLGMRFRQRH